VGLHRVVDRDRKDQWRRTLRLPDRNSRNDRHRSPCQRDRRSAPVELQDVKLITHEAETPRTNNIESLVNYDRRHRSGLPISSSRAEGSVDDIANARMGKRRRMRCSPRGAHRVAVTRAAALYGRLTVATGRRAA